MQQPKRIIWMLDETLVSTPKTSWEITRRLVSKTISSIGNPAMEHVIADPEQLVVNLGQKLAGKSFSCIIDLSGWMGKVLKPIIKSPLITTDFSISRIREASHPSLPTSGHVTSLAREEKISLSLSLDTSKPLILDDTSFSGNTSQLTMQELNLDPEKTTHAFLITNSGSLGDQPGANNRLESGGSNVIAGMTINTPEDDGWHITDIWNHSNLRAAITLAALNQEIMSKKGIDSKVAQHIWFSDVFLKTQFNNQIQPDEAKQLLAEGRLITNNPERLLNSQVHTTNPLLWLSPYFIQHIDLPKFIESHQEISSQLETIRSISGKRDTPHFEAIHELKVKVTESIINNHPERR